MSDPTSGTMLILPWQRGVLAEWSIISLYHHHDSTTEQRQLWVVMARNGQLIHIEGDDGLELWNDLSRQATAAMAAPETIDLNNIDL